MFPCASQLREPFDVRGETLLLLLFMLPPIERLPIAEGGRFCESSRCLAVIPEFIPELLGELPTLPFARAVPLTPELTWPPERLLLCALPKLPLVNPRLFMV